MHIRAANTHYYYYYKRRAPENSISVNEILIKCVEMRERERKSESTRMSTEEGCPLRPWTPPFLWYNLHTRGASAPKSEGGIM